MLTPHNNATWPKYAYEERTDTSTVPSTTDYSTSSLRGNKGSWLDQGNRHERRRKFKESCLKTKRSLMV